MTVGPISPVWKHDSNTQISTRNTAINVWQGSAGGLSIFGGTATSDTLSLGPHNNAFASGNTGRMLFKERGKWSDTWTLTGVFDGIIFTGFNDALLKSDSTFTFSNGTNQGSIVGFDWNPTIRYSTGMILTSMPAFRAQAIIQPTTNITDNNTFFAGFDCLNQFQPDLATAITARTANVMGYNAEPRVNIKVGSHASAISRADNLTAYDAFPLAATFGVETVGAQCYVPTIRGMRFNSPVKNAGATVDNYIAADFLDSSVANTLNAAIRNFMSSGGGKYFLYDIGGAESYLRGNLTLGSDLNLVSYNDEAIFYEDSPVFY